MDLKISVTVYGKNTFFQLWALSVTCVVGPHPLNIHEGMRPSVVYNILTHLSHSFCPLVTVGHLRRQVEF